MKQLKVTKGRGNTWFSGVMSDSTAGNAMVEWRIAKDQLKWVDQPWYEGWADDATVQLVDVEDSPGDATGLSTGRRPLGS